MSTAEEEFNKSSNFHPPKGYKPWKIANNYPKESKEQPEWLNIDYKQHPRDYSEAVKKYILEGNVENNFVVQDNKVRNWYHPVWLHYMDKDHKGREPISGLRFGGSVPKKYLSETQDRILQGWLCSYFNEPAATVMGKMWEKHDDPKWDENHLVKFPRGSIIFENIFCDVAEDELRSLKSAPTADACIAEVKPDGEPNLAVRNSTATRLRLVQTDFAARDTRYDNDPNHIGWVMGTFIYDGTKPNPDGKPWNNVIPVGIQWGNDPSLTQQAHDDGKLSNACWISGHALDVWSSWKPGKAWLGWHGRLNGPADDFMSTCTSCHSTAQFVPAGKKSSPWVQDPNPQQIVVDGVPSIWVQKDEEAIKKWFRNVKAGEPFDEGCLSADYNRHVQFGYEYYLDWKKKHDLM